MKTLDKLIRLHRYRLRERQKALVALEAKAQRLKGLADALEVEAAIEEANAGLSELGTFGFGAYLKRVQIERERLHVAATELAVHVNAARVALRAAFAELKRIETLREQKRAAAQAEFKKREQAALDEVAITQHVRGDN